MLTTERKNGLVTVPKFNILFPAVCVLYICVWSVFPMFQVGNIFRFAALGCALGWFFVINARRNYILDKQDSIMLLFVLLVVVVSIVENMGVGALLSSIATFMLFIGYYMVKHYERTVSPLLFISVAVLAVLIYSNFKTFINLETNSQLTRSIVRNDEETYGYLNQGIGGYGLIYCQVCIFPLVISWTVNAFKRNIYCFILGVVWIVSYVLLVLNAGYTIAVAATAIGLVLTLSRVKKSVFYSILIAVLVVVLVYFLIIYSEGFKNFLLELFNGTTVTRKINDVYDSFWNQTEANTIDVRINAYSRSIEGMLTYPILGGFWGSVTGGHSAIMDTVSKYGWFGGYALISMIFYVPVNIKKRSKDKRVRQIANAEIVTILIIMLLDTMPYQLTMSMTVISLALFKDLIRWREQT